jgi:hypothetical protein
MNKKLGYVCLVFLLALSLAGTGWAMEKSGMSGSSHTWRMGGVVSGIDAQNHSISIHQESVHHNWVKEWRLSEDAARELSNIQPGDVVNVWGKGKTVMEIEKVS